MVQSNFYKAYQRCYFSIYHELLASLGQLSNTSSSTSKGIVLATIIHSLSSQYLSLA